MRRGTPDRDDLNNPGLLRQTLTFVWKVGKLSPPSGTNDAQQEAMRLSERKDV